jgi:hypothetical protein
MRPAAQVAAMLALLTEARTRTQAADFMDGAIDALGFVLADTERDIPPAMLGWWLVVDGGRLYRVASDDPDDDSGLDTGD